MRAAAVLVLVFEVVAFRAAWFGQRVVFVEVSVRQAAFFERARKPSHVHSVSEVLAAAERDRVLR
jgi:hypothetical protein